MNFGIVAALECQLCAVCFGKGADKGQNCLGSSLVPKYAVEVTGGVITTLHDRATTG